MVSVTAHLVGMHSAIKMLNARVRLIMQVIQKMQSGEEWAVLAGRVLEEKPVFCCRCLHVFAGRAHLREDSEEKHVFLLLLRLLTSQPTTSLPSTCRGASLPPRPRAQDLKPGAQPACHGHARVQQGLSEGDCLCVCV